MKRQVTIVESCIVDYLTKNAPEDIVQGIVAKFTDGAGNLLDLVWTGAQDAVGATLTSQKAKVPIAVAFLYVCYQLETQSGGTPADKIPEAVRISAASIIASPVQVSASMSSTSSALPAPPEVPLRMLYDFIPSAFDTASGMAMATALQNQFAAFESAAVSAPPPSCTCTQTVSSGGTPVGTANCPLITSEVEGCAVSKDYLASGQICLSKQHR
jgi:hypothetical protein